MPLYLKLVLAVIGTALYATAVEYIVHRFLDHRRITFFGYRVRLFDHLYDSHSMIHHSDYSGGDSYVFQGIVTPMTWIDVPLFIWSHISVAPVYAALYFGFGWQSVVASASYITFHELILYSTIHYFMHHPRARFWARLWPIYQLNLHHWLHHRHQNKNYAFTFPIFDYLSGTKCHPTPEERTEFAQVIEKIAAPISK